MKIGSDGGIGAPYIINPPEDKKCKCCGQMAELRMGICWDCAECESVIETGEDMYDKPIPKIENYSNAMSKLQYIIKRFREDLR